VNFNTNILFAASQFFNARERYKLPANRLYKVGVEESIDNVSFILSRPQHPNRNVRHYGTTEKRLYLHNSLRFSQNLYYALTDNHRQLLQQ
jgi:hypothetical protein